MDDLQIAANIVACVAIGALSYAMGWWNRGQHERSKRNLQEIESIVVAT